jgi:predicted nucleic acid-binding protein
MSGGKVALDTNLAIAVMNNTDDIAAWVDGFAEIYLPAPVLGELLYSALSSSREEANLQRVCHFALRCSVLPVTAQTEKSMLSSGSNSSANAQFQPLLYPVL